MRSRGPNAERDEPYRIKCSVCGFSGIDLRVQSVGAGSTDTGNTDGTAKDPVTVTADNLGVTSVARATVQSASNCPHCGTNNFIDGSRRC